MLPPAPARLSITTGWPSPSESRVPTARAMVSLAPPGAKPSTKRIGRAGYSAAWTVEKTGSRKAIAAATTQPDLFDTGSPFQGHFTPRIARGRASLATGLQPDTSPGFVFCLSPPCAILPATSSRPALGRSNSRISRRPFMKQAQRIRGVLSPVVTPFNRDLSPDPRRFIAHCQWLLTQNCGLAVFGTNSEANSLSVNERIALLDALLAADVDPSRMMPGTGCCALTDTVRLTEHAVKAGCAGVLMLPPFYYKDVSEDGLYRNFAEVVERVGDSRLRIYLYHIPP